MREYRLMQNAIDKFCLDLTGKTVFTEAATNEFLWTPIIAAIAGADHVFAVSGASRYGTIEEVVNATMMHARNFNVEKKITISKDKDLVQVSQADIVTNLGFVRPLDAKFVDHLHSGAVICLMWEPWEFRSGDIDLKACEKKGIPIIGTNERDPRLQTYNYVAITVVKLLLEHSIEIFDTTLLILGEGPFVESTANVLTRLGARVSLNESDLQSSPDCIICLEHRNRNPLIGPENKSFISGCRTSPLILHVCGNIDSQWIQQHGAQLVPQIPAPFGFMSFTTGHLGPKPVIDLHTAGLKVGQAWLDKEREELDRLARPITKLK